MKIAIIKYNAGNTQSLLFALERIGCTAIVTDETEQILSADKVIFPGVGEAGSAMNYLKSKNIDVVLPQLVQPVLGICLGMQLLCKHTEEANTAGLKIFDTDVKKFTDGKVPHMGWNKLKGSTSLTGTADNLYYFVHSYYAAICDDTVAVTDYGIQFSSVLQKENFYGVQFHPEKSAKAGEQLLKNFLAL
jgi:imidazole glycerol-phosphate synthase subunit HisH